MSCRACVRCNKITVTQQQPDKWLENMRPFVTRSFILQGKKNTEIGGIPQVVAEDCWYIISATDYFSI